MALSITNSSRPVGSASFKGANALLSGRFARPVLKTRRSDGFTMIEVLGVIALIAMATGLIAASFANLIVAVQDKSVEERFRLAVKEARITAGTDKEVVYLRYDVGKEEFSVIKRGELSAETSDEKILNAIKSPDEQEVLFFPQFAKAEGVGRFKNEYAEDPVKYLTFHPSGANTPAQILFRQGFVETRMTLDAFSSGPAFDLEE